MLIGALVVVLLVGTHYGFPWLVRWLQVYRWNRTRGVLALSYDDGPDPETTTALLDLLDELGVPASFYLVGFRARNWPDVVQRLASSQHLLGSHSDHHYHAWKVPPWTELQDTISGIRSLGQSLAGNAPHRPPFGKITAPTMLWLWWHGRTVHWWCFDTEDTEEQTPRPDEIAASALDSGKPVVLMHCHHAEPEKRAHTLAVTRELIVQARARGIKFVRMDELSTAAA